MNNRITRGVGASFLVVTALAVSTAAVGVNAQGETYILTPFDVPDAAVTQAYGINARGDIVGTFQYAAPYNKNHGFLLRRGIFTVIDFPGSSTDYSIATGIGPGGDIVGYYGLVGGAPTSGYGFLLNKHGEWTTVPNPVDPAPTMTPGPFRILPNGTMVGCFHYATPLGAYASMHGFTLMRDGTFSRFDYPASGSMAMHYGATPDGRMIVGVYVVSGTNHGYVLNDGDVITFDVPGSARTTPQDINADGIVVGTYRNPGEPATRLHGFLLNTHLSMNQADWEYTFPFDIPDASITRLRGINAAGQIVGDYVGADGRTRGFVASPTGE